MQTLHSLLDTGGLRLAWNGTTANGTVYAVWRRTNAEAAFSQIATSGRRSHDDQTVPAGSAEVAYFLRTVRDGLVSDDSEPITVRLGVAVGGPDPASTNPAAAGMGLAA